MINKDQNTTLQITIKKSDFKKLELIQNDISNKLKIDLTKSQTITYLINFFASENGAKETKPKANKIIKADNQTSAEFYGDKISQLREKANLTNKQIAEQIGATRDQVQHWSANQTKPHGEQLTKLNELLTKYEII